MGSMRLAPLSVLLLLAAACGRADEARHYKAPKDPSWRILGAVAPAPTATWFFKLAAPAERLDSVKPEVVAFYAKLKLEDGQVRWTLPPGWTEEKGGPQREATIKFGDKEPKLEISVTRFAGDGGGMLPNLNRWRNQLGLEPVTETELSSQAKKLDGASGEVWLVDLTGPNRPAAGPRMASRPAPSEPEPAPSSRRQPTLDDIRSMFAFERPPAWKENPQPSQGRIFEFSIEEGAGKALVTVYGMQGGGDLASNINRWRGQAGLDPIGEAEVSRAAAPVSFAGNEAWFVEAIGKERGILVVASLNPQLSLFFKMDGTPSVVEAQKAAFMRAAQTFQMKGRHE